MLSTPQSANDWPEKPAYEPLWDNRRLAERANVVMEEASARGGQTVLQIYRQGYEAVTLEMKADYDKALSEALFRVWQLEGLLKGRK